MVKSHAKKMLANTFPKIKRSLLQNENFFELYIRTRQKQQKMFMKFECRFTESHIQLRSITFDLSYSA